MPPFLNIPRRSPMTTETKPMVQSSVLWGLAGIAIPALTEACQYVGALPAGIVPAPIAYGVAALGWILAMYGRFYGSNKPISGVLSPK